ncbi:MAG: selenocysteine-specific translation elongation factor [Deltaproteobacteria bacterium]|nr:selenocysteine-specific translation elongation factor [Deltaproteobacteria bacterium]
MKRVIIGTAGHVDHGKTSLIKALTGVDCDRLKEEKDRGLTIELGFTHLGLPSGANVGIVDVPGHVKFIRHMLSGASGIDLVLLVVAADEGVMPQTVEHVRICELLGIKKAVVALTKIDLVDKDLLALAENDARGFLKTTIYDNSRIVPVSSTTGEGLEELVKVIDQAVESLEEKKAGGIPILPIDRVFTMKGFGAVITGTLLSGKLEVSQEVEILPGNKRAKIRGIQVHSRAVSESLAGMRTAVNLQGINATDISRGGWLVQPETFRTTRIIDAIVNLLKKPGKRGIRLYIGTAEVLGDINLYTVDGNDVARIRLRDRVLATYGDRFILRTVSPMDTIGGGVVLNPYPMRRFSQDIIRDLMDDRWDIRVRGIIKDAGIRGVTPSDIFSRFSDQGPHLRDAIDKLIATKDVFLVDPRNELLVSTPLVERLKLRLKEEVGKFHSMHRAAPGIAKEHLRSLVAFNMDTRLFQRVLGQLMDSCDIEEDGPYIRLAGFRPRLAEGLEQLEDRINQILDKSGFEPPRVASLKDRLNADVDVISEVLDFMVRSGKVVRIKDDIYLSSRFAAELADRVRQFIKANVKMAPSDMKKVIGVSRKYAIPYLEYLDRIRVTVRVGNERKLAT